MSSGPIFRIFVVVMALGLVAAACGSGDGAGDVGDSTTTRAMNMDEGDDHSGEFEFGEPADAADAERVIEITAGPGLTFEPAGVTVSVGETVTFRVTNVAAVPHDFTLGDAHMQDEHEAEMAEMSDGDMSMHDEPNAFGLEGGETKEMTWRFTAAGEILFGCHVTGHYDAGMKGTVSIAG